MFDKNFFKNYIEQEISLNISEDEKPFWITGKTIKIKDNFFFFRLTMGNRSGTIKTILYSSVKEVDLPPSKEVHK